MESKGNPSGSEKLSTSIGRGVDEVTVSAHDRINQMSEAARPAVDRMASNAHAAIDTVAGVAATAVDTLGIKGDQLANAQSKLADAARAYMRERPIVSLGIAVAVGWVLGRLMR